MKFSLAIPLLLAGGLLLTACGDSDTTSQTTSASDGSSDTTTDTTNSGTVADNNPVISPNGTLIPDGARLLASQCFQCHGTNGHSQTGIDSLSGESESELIEEMREMKSENEDELMHYQARGYSDTQIRALAAYIAALPDNGNHDDRDDEEEEDDDD